MLLECVREGDTAIVTRIDRLARSMKDLQVHELKRRGVALKATEQCGDCGEAGRLGYLGALCLGIHDFEILARSIRLTSR